MLAAAALGVVVLSALYLGSLGVGFILRPERMKVFLGALGRSAQAFTVFGWLLVGSLLLLGALLIRPAAA